ncbi:MAG: hypothetical protein OXB94_00280, partial [Nitrospira sp.]|nr:hypothetical protein [Nitrospira sp.]
MAFVAHPRPSFCHARESFDSTPLRSGQARESSVFLFFIPVSPSSYDASFFWNTPQNNPKYRKQPKRNNEKRNAKG